MKQINIINTIICMAETEIEAATGLSMRLIVVNDVKALDNGKSPEGMLTIIAQALEMDYSDYTARDRSRSMVELRQIGCYLLKDFFEGILTLKQIGLYFDQDHTTVMYSVGVVDKMLHIRNKAYESKYEAALAAVTQWLAQ